MPGLIDCVTAALDARLSLDADRPVALALSGGGTPWPCCIWPPTGARGEAAAF
ncbi:hypothetical protein [Brevundimonas denitrificans]|uniref:hypothetical protein n=1 Tax=Brevundimonas denitrificans TaxID=1443434 RepID=UPI00223B3BEF|nr:hypothetical protein [Brevundimonas denitrificans]